MIVRQILPQIDRDGALIITATTIRSLGYGFFSIFLGVYLTLLDFTPFQAGLVFSAIMAGGALSNVVASWRGDTIGRKRMLVAMSVLMAVGGVLFTLNPTMIGFILVGLIAMTTSSGGDRTAFISLDTAILAQISEPRNRTYVFVWYTLLGAGAKAFGALLIAIPPLLGPWLGLDQIRAFQSMLVVYTLIAAAGIFIYAMLSPRVELVRAPVAENAERPQHTRGVIFRMTSLFALDAFGGGLMSRAFMVFWFVTKFDATPAAIAAIFFVGQILNVVSVSMATPVARRIGLINTMAFTQMLSNGLMIGMVFMGNLWLALTFFLLRELTNDMDIPTRQSYTMAIVPPEARTAMASMSNLGRTVAQTVAPLVGGIVAQTVFLGMPFLAGSGVKLVYNTALYFQFRGIKTPEERGDASTPQATLQTRHTDEPTTT